MIQVSKIKVKYLTYLQTVSKTSSKTIPEGVTADWFARGTLEYGRCLKDLAFTTAFSPSTVLGDEGGEGTP